MESRKMVLTNLFAGSGEDADIENRLVDTVGGKERESKMYRDGNMETYNTICKLDSQ